MVPVDPAKSWCCCTRQQANLGHFCKSNAMLIIDREMFERQSSLLDHSRWPALERCILWYNVAPDLHQHTHLSARYLKIPALHCMQDPQ